MKCPYNGHIEREVASVENKVASIEKLAQLKALYTVSSTKGAQPHG